MTNPNDTFREFSPPPTGSALSMWRDWFADHGIDPDVVAFTGVPGVCPVTWVERRANPGQLEVVYLVAVTDINGQPIVQEHTITVSEPPAPFPDL